jgi:hypothetical protein
MLIGKGRHESKGEWPREDGDAKQRVAQVRKRLDQANDCTQRNWNGRRDQQILDLFRAAT